ncbi:arylesterase [Paraglaciecola hydrolytica]|uniref:Arylesterase n=1 Tax=Paraglaciecola hydrolytica TaxID=1799789 RepID=A0A136A3D6_9ALTE|nr:arylesterase [Paraglaciecola hydrolytica]KXI29755.1 arylesterase [Paraglaciecola hydrolytica]
MIVKFTQLFKSKLKVCVLLIPILLISDQLWAKETKLLILGDSLSAAYGISQAEGWVSLLQDMWKNQSITVINGAISGETTDGALARLPRLLEQHQPSHIYVELGGNDGLQGHPLKKMQQNLAQIITLSQQQDVIVILQAMRIPTNYGKRYTDMFNQSYWDLAKEFNISILPFFIENIATDSSLMQKDGIHPNVQAQLLIAQDMQDKLGAIIFTSRTINKQLD